MHYCTFVKIENSHDRLRDDIISGMAPELPEIGKSFFMYTEGKEFGNRYLRTSFVTSIEDFTDEIVFRTENGSIYLLKDIKKAIPE